MKLEPELERYIEEQGEEEPSFLAELRRETHLTVMRPRMLSGNMQGQFLKMLCRVLKAERVLEIGTYTGYAALSMAAGLIDGGLLYTLDINDELEDIVLKYIEKSGLKERIRYSIGDALDLVPRLPEVFDLVFIDADKRQYCDYYRAVFDKVRPGGLIVADDVLWDGKIVGEKEVRDAQTRGIMEFNAMVKADDRVEKFILPVRHGLYMIRKK